MEYSSVGTGEMGPGARWSAFKQGAQALGRKSCQVHGDGYVETMVSQNSVCGTNVIGSEVKLAFNFDCIGCVVGQL